MGTESHEIEGIDAPIVYPWKNPVNVGDAQIWQIAAGDAERSYADVCLRWGVVLLGPG